MKSRLEVQGPGEGRFRCDDLRRGLDDLWVELLAGPQGQVEDRLGVGQPSCSGGGQRAPGARHPKHSAGAQGARGRDREWAAGAVPALIDPKEDQACQRGVGGGGTHAVRRARRRVSGRARSGIDQAALVTGEPELIGERTRIDGGGLRGIEARHGSRAGQGNHRKLGNEDHQRKGHQREYTPGRNENGDTHRDREHRHERRGQVEELGANQWPDAIALVEGREENARNREVHVGHHPPGSE